jgi:signal transduction histidine kinase
MKLLNRTIRSYIVYSSFILLISVPVFYLVIKTMVAKDVDEGLIAQKEELVRKLDRLVLLNPFDWLNLFEPDISLTPSAEIRSYDTLYTTSLFDKRSHRNIPYRVLESNVLVKGIPYDIQLKSSLLNNEDLIKSIVLVQALLMILIAAGLWLINRSLSKESWNPFYRTLDKLNRYNIESKEQLHFEPTDIDEFNRLNNTISALTHRNQQAYQAQKEFTENASHEMQSPLAVLQSKTELLMQTTPLSEEQAELISELTTAGQRMNRLNKSLLLLSKIENQQFPGTELVDLRAILSNLLAQYENSISQKGLRVSFQSTSPVEIRANRTLLEALLGNLVSNSIRHNVPGGQIELHLDGEELVIQNTGKPTALDSKKLFTRFQKQSTEVTGTGLGLEIAKKICDLNGFTLHYAFANGWHCFRLRFVPLTKTGSSRLSA